MGGVRDHPHPKPRSAYLVRCFISDEFASRRHREKREGIGRALFFLCDGVCLFDALTIQRKKDNARGFFQKKSKKLKDDRYLNPLQTVITL